MLKALKFAAIAWLLTSGGAFAQSSPGLAFGQVPTAAQWNSYFAAKADYTPGASAGAITYWNGSAFVSLPGNTTGSQCLSESALGVPSWAACSGGGGGSTNPGGANTQVQFNNAGVFGASANLTWASPTLAIGQAASITGVLQLANGNPGGTSISLQNVAATSAYNYNFPATAGTAGAVLLSGGGGSSSNTWTGGSLAITSGKAFSVTNSLTLAGTDSTTQTFPSQSATLAALNLADQTVSGGANVTSFNIGTVTSGTTTVDCGKAPLQYMTNGGASTIAAPANDGSCMIQITNNGSAGAITFSGFTTNSQYTGGSLDTTNGHLFMLSVQRINGSSILFVIPQQ